MALVSLVPSSLFVVSGPFAAFDSLAFWKKIDLEAYEQKLATCTFQKLGLRMYCRSTRMVPPLLWLVSQFRNCFAICTAKLYIPSAQLSAIKGHNYWSPTTFWKAFFLFDLFFFFGQQHATTTTNTTRPPNPLPTPPSSMCLGLVATALTRKALGATRDARSKRQEQQHINLNKTDGPQNLQKNHCSNHKLCIS